MSDGSERMEGRQEEPRQVESGESSRSLDEVTFAPEETIEHGMDISHLGGWREYLAT